MTYVFLAIILVGGAIWYWQSTKKSSLKTGSFKEDKITNEDFVFEDREDPNLDKQKDLKK